MAEKNTTKKAGYVAVNLPLTTSDEPQQEVVGLNGTLYTIKRGETVYVPEGVKRILDASEKAKQDAIKAAQARAIKEPGK